MNYWIIYYRHSLWGIEESGRKSVAEVAATVSAKEEVAAKFARETVEAMSGFPMSLYCCMFVELAYSFFVLFHTIRHGLLVPSCFCFVLVRLKATENTYSWG